MSCVVLFDYFAGTGIPRDGLELVGERYGIVFIQVVSKHMVLDRLTV